MTVNSGRRSLEVAQRGDDVVSRTRVVVRELQAALKFDIPSFQ